MDALDGKRAVRANFLPRPDGGDVVDKTESAEGRSRVDLL